MIRKGKRDHFSKISHRDIDYWHTVKENLKPVTDKIDTQEIADTINENFYNISKDHEQSDKTRFI